LHVEHLRRGTAQSCFRVSAPVVWRRDQPACADAVRCPAPRTAAPAGRQAVAVAPRLS
jgi:hypothetical protein